MERIKEAVILLCIVFVSGCGTIEGGVGLVRGIAEDVQTIAEYADDHIVKEKQNDTRPTSLAYYSD